MNDATPVPPPVVDSTFDHTRPLFADGPPDPVVYDGSPRAIRQRTVNFAAKRFADMMYVTGLDRSTAEQHFRWRPLGVPGGLSGRPDVSGDQGEMIAAHRSGRLTIETNDADRRATVRWSDPAFGTPLSGSAIARPGYGGILLYSLWYLNGDGLLAAWLSRIGQSSYSIYLWHLPMGWFSVMIFQDRFNWGRNLVFGTYVVASVLMGIGMAHAIERPWLRVRDRLFPEMERRPYQAIHSATEQRDTSPVFYT